VTDEGDARDLDTRNLRPELRTFERRAREGVVQVEAKAPRQKRDDEMQNGSASAVPERTTLAARNVRMFVRPPKRRRRRSVGTGTGFPLDPRRRVVFAPRTSARFGIAAPYEILVMVSPSVRNAYGGGK
jgi:hypothetical protein